MAFVFFSFTCWATVIIGYAIIVDLEPIKLVVEVIGVGVEVINFVAELINLVAMLAIAFPRKFK